MTDLASAATLYGPEDLRVVDRDLGPLNPGMVRVRFKAGGICGSDLHYFRHARTGDFVVASPLVLGHEIAGEIAETGDGVTTLKVGDRVAVNPSRWCGACARCREGRPNLCEAIYFMGSASKTPHMQGGFSTLFDAAPEQCAVLPASVPFAAAALAEPLAVALHAVERAGAVAGANVCIVGAGPIGLLIMMAARLAGAGQVTVADVASAPLAFAAQLGADRTIDVAKAGGDLAAASGGGFDAVLEVSGTADGLASAISVARPGGVVVQVGNLPGDRISVPANAVMAKELTLAGTFRFGAEFFKAVDLIAAGKVDVTRLITGEMPLASAVDAFRLALDRGRSVKVMLSAQ